MADVTISFMPENHVQARKLNEPAVVFPVSSLSYLGTRLKLACKNQSMNQ